VLGVILATWQGDQGWGNLNLLLGVSWPVLMCTQSHANLYHGIICGAVIKRALFWL